MGLKFDDSKVKRMTRRIKKERGGSARVVIGPFGMHSKMDNPTLTGELMSYHVYGRGNNPVRDPLGFGKDGRRYWSKAVSNVMRHQWTVKDALVNTGDFMARLIVLRMAKGINKDGGALKPYSDGYKKYKTEFGGRKKGQKNRSAKPNLTFTGITKESINYRVYMR